MFQNLLTCGLGDALQHAADTLPGFWHKTPGHQMITIFDIDRPPEYQNRNHVAWVAKQVFGLETTWRNMSRVVQDVFFKMGAVLTNITSVQDPYHHLIKQIHKSKLGIDKDDEVWAFHGTREEFALDMAKNGIKPVCGRSLWGRGFYSTTILKLALYYSVKNMNNEFTIVVCRVAKGKTAVGAPDMIPAGDVNTLIGQNEASSYLVSPDKNLVAVSYVLKFKLNMMRADLHDFWALSPQLNEEYKARLPHLKNFYNLLNEMRKKRNNMVLESTRTEQEKKEENDEIKRAYSKARGVYPDWENTYSFVCEQAKILEFNLVSTLTILNNFKLVFNCDQQKQFERQFATLKLIEAKQDSQVAE
jgi:hypothetical protein